MTIPKTEREELRRIVRGDFKALKMEIEVRRAELLAEIEKRVAQRFMPHETALQRAEEKLTAIVMDANEKLRRVVTDTQRECEGYQVRCHLFETPRFWLVRERRDEMRAAMVADLDARVEHAKARMARQENDLLKKLASDALESDEAKAFLTQIPKVAELVPESRLAELEAQFEIAPKELTE